MCIVSCRLLAMIVAWHMSTCWPTTLVQDEMSQQLLDGLFPRKKIQFSQYPLILTWMEKWITFYSPSHISGV